MGFDATEWAPLMSFRAPSAIQAGVKRKCINWHIHRIEDANGDLNLDHYPVTVSALPSVGGRKWTAAELLSYIRMNINAFIHRRIASFAPYDKTEAAVWSSSSPLGAVIHIAMKAFGGWLNPDDGSVVCSEYAPDHWTFSTIWTVMDLAHPVSGNREFGFKQSESGELTFYTRGVDRCTSVLDEAAMSIVFSSAHSLWLSFQKGIADFVNSNGGSATVAQATSVRTPWEEVKAVHFSPSIPWI